MGPPEFGPIVKPTGGEIVAHDGGMLGSFFDLGEIELSLVETKFRARDSIMMLVEIMRSHAASYSERMRAEKQLRELVKDAMELGGQIVNRQQQISGTDSEGRQLTETRTVRQMLEQRRITSGNSPSPGIFVRKPGEDQARIEEGAKRAGESDPVGEDSDTGDHCSGDAGHELGEGADPEIRVGVQDRGSDPGDAD